MEPYRYPTGIAAVDDSLGGGFLQGSLVLLEYDTGSPKDIFIREFLKSGINSGEQTYAALTDSKISQILNEDELCNCSKNDFNIVVDCFTNAFGWSEVKPHTKHRVGDISDIKNVHTALRTAVEDFDRKKHMRGLIDSLSTLLMAENYAKHKEKQNPSQIPKYLLHQSVMCKDTGSVLMCTLHQRAQDEFFERRMENISDYVIRLETKDSERGYRNYISILTSRHHNRPSAKYEAGLVNGQLIISGV